VRLAAMRLALASHGLELAKASIFDGDFSRAGGEQAAAKFVDADCAATAIVSANDQAAIGFVRGLRSRHVVVPDDVSVVGFDDIAPCPYVEPPLTTVHVPLYELGVQGMRLAFDLLVGKDRPKPHEFPLELTIRSTTAPPPRQHPEQEGTP
jgi:LacI family transcriptional regulator